MSNFTELRRAAFEANIEIKESGLVVLTWGNASAADHDAGVFAIKPSGVAYADLTPDHMVIVDIESGKTIEGDLRPSSDTPTHQRIYQAFDIVGGVVHTHSVHATSFAQAERVIPCLGTTHADHFAGDIPVARLPDSTEIDTDYEGATGDIIVEQIRGSGNEPLAVPAILLPHHGPFTWGTTVAEAVKNAVALEAVAQMAIHGFAIHGLLHAGEPQAIPAELLAKHQSRKHGPNAYYGQPKS